MIINRTKGCFGLPKDSIKLSAFSPTGGLARPTYPNMQTINIDALILHLKFVIPLAKT